MQEEWRDVVGYEGLYQVSNLGRIKILSRIAKRSDGKKQSVHEKIAKQQLSTSGYPSVTLLKNGRYTSLSVHSLMAQAFLNHTTLKGFVIDHIDGNRTNNTLNNLEIITHRENVSKGFKNFNKTSRYTGVYLDRKNKKYKSFIRVNGKKLYLGSFNCETKAYLAYQNKLKEINNG